MAIAAPLMVGFAPPAFVHFLHEKASSLNWIRWDCSRAGQTMTVENSEQIEKIDDPAKTPEITATFDGAKIQATRSFDDDSPAAKRPFVRSGHNANRREWIQVAGVENRRGNSPAHGLGWGK
jgi:hypothetical protein